MDLMTRYLYTTFEPSSLGVLQGLTDLAHGQPLVDQQGEDYFKLFEALQSPLLVICADKDDLVNMEDSLRCFENSTSNDKTKIVYVSQHSRKTASYGHCDIIVGQHAVTHVWEKVRIWLDQRRKLGMEYSGRDASREYVLSGSHDQDLIIPGEDDSEVDQSFFDKVIEEAYLDD